MKNRCHLAGEKKKEVNIDKMKKIAWMKVLNRLRYFFDFYLKIQLTNQAPFLHLWQETMPIYIPATITACVWHLKRCHLTMYFRNSPKPWIAYALNYRILVRILIRNYRCTSSNNLSKTNAS